MICIQCNARRRRRHEVPTCARRSAPTTTSAPTDHPDMPRRRLYRAARMARRAVAMARLRRRRDGTRRRCPAAMTPNHPPTTSTRTLSARQHDAAKYRKRPPRRARARTADGPASPHVRTMPTTPDDHGHRRFQVPTAGGASAARAGPSPTSPMRGRRRTITGIDARSIGSDGASPRRECDPRSAGDRARRGGRRRGARRTFFIRLRRVDKPRRRTFDGVSADRDRQRPRGERLIAREGRRARRARPRRLQERLLRGDPVGGAAPVKVGASRSRDPQGSHRRRDLVETRACA